MRLAHATEAHALSQHLQRKCRINFLDYTFRNKSQPSSLRGIFQKCTSVQTDVLVLTCTSKQMEQSPMGNLRSALHSGQIYAP